METIRVSNLRCIADSTVVEIKPISLLVGANSSGKSTFLRVFPLLKQSQEMRTLGGLVLNEGDVNFGFFNEALNKDADPPEMKLEFGFTLQRGVFQGAPWNSFLFGSVQAKCELVYVKRAKDQRYPRLRTIKLSLMEDQNKDTIEIHAEDEGEVSKFSVNDLELRVDAGQLRLQIGRGLIPRLLWAPTKDNEGALFEEGTISGNPFAKALLGETDSLFHGRTSKENRLAMFRAVPIGSPLEMLDGLRNQGASSWVERTRHWTPDSLGFRKVRNYVLAGRTNDFLESLNVSVTQLARSVHYFQPVRAGVERDYLSRDVSVTSVDPTGLNVAMVLANLPPQALKEFRDWMRNYFGFEVFPQSVADGARIALRMKDAISGTEFNLADTGFGFSQMLPFLVQIWSLGQGRPYQGRPVYPGTRYRYTGSRVASDYLIAIEQPELHLHPALQARLADLIVSVARVSREKKTPIRFMLETHSPTIIERIGQLVEIKSIAAEDVQVLLFEPDPTSPRTNIARVRSTSFDSQGVLQDWPFGFLSAPVSEPAITDPLQKTDAIPDR
jgi:AAA ATPase domain